MPFKVLHNVRTGKIILIKTLMQRFSFIAYCLCEDNSCSPFTSCLNWIPSSISLAIIGSLESMFVCCRSRVSSEVLICHLPAANGPYRTANDPEFGAEHGPHCSIHHLCKVHCWEKWEFESFKILSIYSVSWQNIPNTIHLYDSGFVLVL